MSTNYIDRLFAQQQVTFSEGLPSWPELANAQRYETDDLLSQVQSNFQFLRRKLNVAHRRIADAVSIEPSIMHGNPVFKDTRIPIYQIVEELADGTSFEALTEGYPALTADKIRSGLDFVSSLLRIYDESEDISY